jgi:hypothetical protein
MTKSKAVQLTEEIGDSEIYFSSRAEMSSMLGIQQRRCPARKTIE